MENSYLWMPSSSAPCLYPVSVHLGYLIVNNNKAIALPSARLLNNGLTESSLTYLTNISVNTILPLGIDLIWLSLVDKKFYTVSNDFNTNQLKEIFDKGYYTKDGEKTTFNSINVGFIPGGRVIIYLIGDECIKEFTMFQGSQIDLDMNSFIPNGNYKSLEEYLSPILSKKVSSKNLDKDRWIFNYQQFGVDYSLYDNYREKFYYIINFNSVLKGILSLVCNIWFTNFEYLKIHQYSSDKYSFKSRPRSIHYGINYDSEHYSIDIYFDEDEVIELFSIAFNGCDYITNNNLAELNINVLDAYSTFDVSLNTKNGKFVFQKLKVNVEQENKEDNTSFTISNFDGERPFFKGE